MKLVLGTVFGDDTWFPKYRWCTHMAKDFLTILFHYCKQRGDDEIFRALLRLLRMRECCYDISVVEKLHLFVFRALLLREDSLQCPHDDYVCDAAAKRHVDATVHRWSTSFLQSPGQSARKAHRLFWQIHFGHKSLAMVIATFGVRDWYLTLTLTGCCYFSCQ